MEGLFRHDAVEAQRPQPLGTICPALPVSQQVWGFCAAAFNTAIVLWPCLGHYARRERGTGSLVPTAGLLITAARAAGVVSKSDATPGAHAHAGHAVLTISGDESGAALNNTDVAVAKAPQHSRCSPRAHRSHCQPRPPISPMICTAALRCWASTWSKSRPTRVAAQGRSRRATSKAARHPVSKRFY